MKFKTILPFALSTALLTACASNEFTYLSGSVGENLELPPDLTEYNVVSKFDLPNTFSGDNEMVRDRIPVLAKVESIQLQGSGSLYWLSIQEPVDNLYRVVKNFWASEGYRLVVDEPVIGIMQTEWIFKKEGGGNKDQGWFERFFSGDDLSASQDQFRTRIERAPDGQSKVYIAHRGTAYVYTLEGADDDRENLLTEDLEDNEWQFRATEPELEVEMLSRLMVYLGLNEAEVKYQQANVKMFGPRASLHIDSDERSPFLILRDPYQIAWNRVLHQLERMNFEIESAEFNTGLGYLSESVVVVNTRVQQSDESSGFLFFSPTPEAEVRQIALVLKQESHELTRVMIENADGDFDTSKVGAEFLDLLYKQIK